MQHGYEGTISFARREITREVEPGDIAIVGVPFDLGATYRPGARLGPRAIREQSVFTSGFTSRTWPWDVEIFKEQRVVDYGDIHYALGSTDAMIETVSNEMHLLGSRGVRPIILGGDHVVSYPVLKGLAATYGPLSLVHFDAHCDTWPNEEGLEHGTVFLQAAQDGFIDPSRSIQIGMRTTGHDAGFMVIDSHEMAELSPAELADRIRNRVGSSPTYLTLDIDFLDPAYAPGTGTPVVGGPTTKEVRQMLIALKGLPIVGGDVVEVSPPYDPTAITAVAAATLAMDIAHLLHYSSFDTSVNETLSNLRSGENRRAYRDRFGDGTSRRSTKASSENAKKI